MTFVNVEVTQESQRAVLIRMDRAGDGVRDGLRAGLNAAAIYIASYIKQSLLSGQLVKNRTGNLRRAIFNAMIDDHTAVVGVGSEAPYARFVNDGTAPHEIVATRARALAFEVGGEMIFRRRVMHPGISPRFFMETGLRDSISHVRQIVIERVMRGAKGESTE